MEMSKGDGGGDARAVGGKPGAPVEEVTKTGSKRSMWLTVLTVDEGVMPKSQPLCTPVLNRMVGAEFWVK